MSPQQAMGREAGAHRLEGKEASMGWRSVIRLASPGPSDSSTWTTRKWHVYTDTMQTLEGTHTANLSF